MSARLGIGSPTCGAQTGKVSLFCGIVASVTGVSVRTHQSSDTSAELQHGESHADCRAILLNPILGQLQLEAAADCANRDRANEQKNLTE
eukprot:1293095-Prymnesium_polylepis.1